MAKYYMDTEFNEDFHKPLFGKKRHFIDLISIGIVCEDNRLYYAISKDFDLKSVWNKHEVKVNKDFNNIRQEGEFNPMYITEYWLRDNVLKSIFYDLIKEEKKRTEAMSRITGYSVNEEFTYANLKQLIKRYGKANSQIANEIFEFVNPDLGFHCSAYNNSEFRNKDSYISKHFDFHNAKDFDGYFFAQPEWIAYFGDYDFVLLCSLFGTMMKLPAGFPFYCKDLKQTLDEKAEIVYKGTRYNKEGVDDSLDLKIGWMQGNTNYPKQKNEHNALDDAKWNKDIYEFLKTLN